MKIITSTGKMIWRFTKCFGMIWIIGIFFLFSCIYLTVTGFGAIKDVEQEGLRNQKI